jgi:DNA-binding transcriptional ArsR family regulator
VPVTELDRAPLRAVISPMPTAFTLIRDTLSNGRWGTPLTWRRSVLSRLRSRDAETFAPLTDPQIRGWPTVLEPLRLFGTLDDALQYLAATPGTALLEALESDRDVTPSAVWDPLRRNPDRWLARYVDALRRGWRGVESQWWRSIPLLEREVERIDAAIDRGVSHAQIVDALFTHAALVDGAYTGRRLSVDNRGLTVVPMVGGSRTGHGASPDDCFVQLSYPVAYSWRAFDDEAPPPASLQALLGGPRAALLRRLDDPLTAGGLAELVGLTPGTITFHLRALEAAGLILRERQGSRVLVHRTARGTQLLALYE